MCLPVSERKRQGKIEQAAAHAKPRDLEDVPGKATGVHGRITTTETVWLHYKHIGQAGVHRKRAVASVACHPRGCAKLTSSVL